MRWRLIIDNEHEAFSNMAIDESIMMCSRPTLRIYQWKPAAVSIGYFQSLEQEVDIMQCKRHNIDVVRRITGGGAVFHDKELTYSVVCPEQYVPRKIISSYEVICGAVVDTLRSLGIDAKFSPINDITVNGKKISGSAQTRKHGMVLQHGTIILDVDAEKMFSLLKVPDEKIRDKMIKSVKERVTSVKRELGAENLASLKQYLAESFERKFSTGFEHGTLSSRESELACKLKKRFMSSEWNNMR